jgi:hypothetical protein
MIEVATSITVPIMGVTMTRMSRRTVEEKKNEVKELCGRKVGRFRGPERLWNTGSES